jgi:hypothetical protein
MTEPSKFAGALGRLKQPREASAARSQPERQEQATAPAAIAGKRSDPAFRPTTFFVRKETQRKAARLLEDQDAGKDLSDLVEELLATWIAENSHV